MREVLKVHLHNEKRFYTELTLPATPYVMLDALEKAEKPDWELTRCFVNDELAKHLDPEGSLFELNALAEQLATLDDRQLAIVEGLAKMECTDAAPRVPLPRLIDMAYSTDRCHFLDDVLNDTQLGRFCAENGFVPEADDLSDEAFELLDFARIGREFQQDEGGVFTAQGYVQRYDELREMHKYLDLTPKKPDYTVLVETSSGCEVRLPHPPNDPMGTEPVRCVDCAAPALIGLTDGMERMDLLARRLLGMPESGTLPKFKALAETVGCDDVNQALNLADTLGKCVAQRQVWGGNPDKQQTRGTNERSEIWATGRYLLLRYRKHR